MEEVIITLEQETHDEVVISLEQETNKEMIFLLEQESSDIVTRNYETLENLPKVNGVTLIKDKSFDELGAVSLTNIEIEELINNIVL